MCGDQRIAPRCSSMKLDSSRTTRWVLSISGRFGSSEPPMLPPTQTRNGPRRISPSMAVVVDLPLVPVTPTTVAGERSTERPVSGGVAAPAPRAGPPEPGGGGGARCGKGRGWGGVGAPGPGGGARGGGGGGGGGGGDDQGGAGEVRLALLAQAEVDGQAVEFRDRVAELVGRRLVGH